MSKSQKVTLCVVLLIVLLIAWGLFPLFFKWLMIGIGSKETALKDFGTFGDIYGSLNTLFTSATLIIVMYSAYLQRQANKDARDAMERQLQQAKEDTEEQLKQAREATEQQILNAQQLAHIQLEHARQNSKEQLELAKATHDAQIKESKDAIFTTKFYGLLNYKNDLVNRFELNYNNKMYSGPEVFVLFSEKFKELIVNEWINLDLLNKDELEEEIILFEKKCNNNNEFTDWKPYFSIYVSMLKLIQKLDNNEDKNFFMGLLRNSMNMYEEITLFFLAPYYEDIYDGLCNSYIFSQFYHETAVPYALKFYNAHHFASKKWIDTFINSQTPT